MIPSGALQIFDYSTSIRCFMSRSQPTKRRSNHIQSIQAENAEKSKVAHPKTELENAMVKKISRESKKGNPGLGPCVWVSRNSHYLEVAKPQQKLRKLLALD